MWVMDKESHRCLTFPEEKGTSVRHGHWIEKDDECVCPFCGRAWNYMDNCTETFNFCPNCGAKMQE